MAYQVDVTGCMPVLTSDNQSAALLFASAITMAGDSIRIAENGMLMIHNPWTITMGEAKDMLKAAELLDTVKTSIVGTYASRTEIADEELSKLMDAETWYVGDEAVEAGFATETTANKAIAARFDPQLHNFGRAPEAFRQLVDDKPPKNEESKAVSPNSSRAKLEWAKAVYSATHRAG